VGLRASLDRCRKSRPAPGFDPRTVQSVASLYTDYATRLTQVRYNDTENKTGMPAYSSGILTSNPGVLD
jgi:hypothetical protein